ncbi:MAG: ATP-binding protein [Clostridia bacterium]|nr:ATP-binding protein [Clostridia bacterium]
MAYNRYIYDKAEDVLSYRRQKAFEDAEARREEIYSKLPRVREIERQLASTGFSAAREVAARSSDIKTELTRLKETNQRLQTELRVLLVRNGYTTADLEEQYICPKCTDHGYIDGRMCGCMKSLLREITFKELNSLSPLALATFDTFDLSYYSDTPEDNGKVPRKVMENIYNYCKNYAETFDGHGRSIYMEGGTGLGKTHLSLAIANRVIERGFGVIYCSAPDILEKIRYEHFGKNYTRETLGHLEECDLLILDDLGTEFPNPFTNSVVYNLVNKRIMLQKPTIMNTNLDREQIKKLYTERFLSRMMGEQIYLTFIGKDVRIAKGLKK